MMEDHDDERFEDESRALRSLKEERLPPPGLEDRVTAALSARGLLHTGHNPSRHRRLVLASVAASLLLVAGGAVLGFRLASVSVQPPGERFVLFLYEGSDYEAPAPGKERERVDEYRSWARTLRKSGNLLAGEKLRDGAQVLGGPHPPAIIGGPDSEAGRGAIRGYFVIAARDAGQARSIASTCPHLRYGGWIVLRQIDPV